MKLPPPARRRGQPLAALAILLLGWAGARTALWAADEEQLAAMPRAVAQEQDSPEMPGSVPLAPRATLRQVEEVPAAPPRLIVPLDPADRPVTERPERLPLRIAAGHQLLFFAAVAGPALPEDARAQARPSLALPPMPWPLAGARPARRWSGDGWVLWRQGGNGMVLPGTGLAVSGLSTGAYGASQAGAVLRYRLSPGNPHQPALYLRATTALDRPHGAELAAGVAVRPLSRAPFALMAEARLAERGGEAIVRPAVAIVSTAPPVALPLGLRGEAYGQAGWVGGKDKTTFVDGQARIDRAIWRAGEAEVRVGAGAWGGAQRGASRLDLGLGAAVSLPLGPLNVRLAADYRLRVAGSAAPGSGLAVTFSAGF